MFERGLGTRAFIHLRLGSVTQYGEEVGYVYGRGKNWFKGASYSKCAIGIMRVSDGCVC